MDQMLWYLLAGTRGGPNRLRILGLLKERPYNAHQLSEILTLDYRTVRHHLRVLVTSGLLVNPEEDRYGSLYFLSALVSHRWMVVEDIRAHLVPVVTDEQHGASTHTPDVPRARPA
ncbi:MAG TPA: winged helix-turn-helix domain-containing protein [Thermoplasmata archaeon]|nr:winged helix-turn-helix domain-containing protein [Thermoplasmata archaeon]